MSKNRLEAFSDGVIAILITIMVLELRTRQGTSWAALREDLPHWRLHRHRTGRLRAMMLARWESWLFDTRYLRPWDAQTKIAAARRRLIAVPGRRPATPATWSRDRHPGTACSPRSRPATRSARPGLTRARSLSRPARLSRLTGAACH
jgi:transmembrane protein TMEM174 (potassium channel)